MADYSDGKVEAILNLRRHMEKRKLKYQKCSGMEITKIDHII